MFTTATGEERIAWYQRGGIDSDPLVRLLAWRAWGDRDRQWFEERGVRKGDAVKMAWEKPGLPGVGMRVSARWSSDTEPDGIALHDARPGEMVKIDFRARRYRPVGVTGNFRASDRLREEPARPSGTQVQELTDEFGFNLLVIERDPTTRRTMLTADRDGHAERIAVADDVLVSASAPSEALRGCCRELDYELARQGAPRR